MTVCTALPSGGVAPHLDFSLRHVDRPRCPDLDRVHPGALRVVGCQRHVLLELEDRRPLLLNRHAVGSERDLLSVLSRDLGVDVQLTAAVRAYVKVVDALDRPIQLPGDGPFEIDVAARPLGWWRRLA